MRTFSYIWAVINTILSIIAAITAVFAAIPADGSNYRLAFFALLIGTYCGLTAVVSYRD